MILFSHGAFDKHAHTRNNSNNGREIMSISSAGRKSNHANYI